jgi:protein adenylyltransferase
MIFNVEQSLKIPFDNSYAALGEPFYSRQLPTAVEQPELIRLNRPLAEFLGLDPNVLDTPDGVAMFAGNIIPVGADPIATVYGGHQFGSWNPQLGDGRAILLGEVVARNHCRYDIQLKGCGQTPYSRMGDGRSPLGPVLREYIVSEAMAALGVPTTRSLAAVSTGEYVLRQGPLPGAVLTRVGQSHIRIGTFQYFSARGDVESVNRLADHVIARHYPEAVEADNPYLALLEGVILRQAKLIARWQGLGFIHGVMNTDNMLVSGETVDYGPCAFMDRYHPETVYSSIDSQGRYAYQNQPAIGQWNLLWLAQALLPLLANDESEAVELAQNAINEFNDLYQQAWLGTFSGKLGFAADLPGGRQLVDDLLAVMAREKLDFTLTFRALADSLIEEQLSQSVHGFYPLPDSLSDWRHDWRAALRERNSDFSKVQQEMYAANPVYIPRNHLVEHASEAATREGDFQPFHALVDLLSPSVDQGNSPYVFDAARVDFARPPRPEQEVAATFCGT